jgi:hypothetical protein
MIEKPGPANTKLRAVYAFGHASLIGLNGLTVQGTITVRINNIGQAVNRLIELPGDPVAGEDDNGNGIVDEAGETAAIPVNISQGRIEQFAVGLDESGNPAGSSQLVISLAGIFEIRGAVQFTRSPTGRVDVDLPEASVDIRIPDGSGGLQDVFGIRGAAKFFFGGVEGFQLESLQVRGYKLFGAEATLPPAASSLRPPTADLAFPFQSQVFDVANLLDIGGVKYLAVTFNDVNRVGLNAGTITDPGAEFLITATTAAGTPLSISVNDGGVIQHTGVNNDRTFLYPLTVDAAALTSARVTVTFLANSWSDAAGKSNAAEIETFTLFKDTQPAADAPHAVLANPFNGQSINKQALSAKRYIDVTFVTPAGTLVDPASLDGNEPAARLGAANVTERRLRHRLDPAHPAAPSFLVQPKAGVTVENTFVDGEITVQFVAGSWTAGTGAAAIASAASSGTFTVAGAAAAASTNPSPIDLGPLDLFGPSAELVKTGFKDGQLVLTVAIGVNRATLSFGSFTAEFTGLLGTFDVQIDVLKAVQWVTGSASLGEVFSVPGKFRIDIAGLNIEVPNAFRVSGTGIAISYDPGYDPAAAGGAPQQLVVVQTALITFPILGVSGAILPSGSTPGLIVYDNGFAIGEAMLIYDPDGGAVPAGSSTLTPSGGSGQKIAFGDIPSRRSAHRRHPRVRSAAARPNSTARLPPRRRQVHCRPVSATLSDRRRPSRHRARIPEHRGGARGARVRARRGQGLHLQGRYPAHHAGELPHADRDRSVHRHRRRGHRGAGELHLGRRRGHHRLACSAARRNLPPRQRHLRAQGRLRRVPRDRLGRRLELHVALVAAGPHLADRHRLAGRHAADRSEQLPAHPLGHGHRPAGHGQHAVRRNGRRYRHRHRAAHRASS